MNSKYLIYKHTSPSGKSYIGQTKNLKRRDRKHQEHNNGCAAFASAIKKYGWDNFTHEILIDGLSIEDSNICEEQLIKEHNTLYPNGYNLKPGGLNHTLLDETRERIIASNKGRIRSDAAKLNIKNACQGRTLSQSHRDKIAQSNKGRKFSDETKMKISKSKIGQKNPMFGKEVSQDTRDKLSKSLSGKTQSKESNIKRSESHKGILHSEESKIKMSIDRMGEKNHRYGSKHSEETKIKMSKSASGEKNHRFGKTGKNSDNAKTYLITYPDGRNDIIYCLAEFCRGNGLTESALYAVANGRKKHHKNFKCSHYNDGELQT